MIYAHTRAHVRIPFISYITFSVFDETGKCVVQGQRGIVKNIGVGGLFFETIKIKSSALQLLTHGRGRFVLQLSLPQIKQPFYLKAVLRWFKGEADYVESYKNGFGVAFVEVGVFEKERLVDYVTARQLQEMSV